MCDSYTYLPRRWHQYRSWTESSRSRRGTKRRTPSAKVTQDLSGGVTGKGQVEWLMSYGDDGTAHFVGLQQFEGVIDDREGSVVLETIGEFDGKQATWDCKVV